MEQARAELEVALANVADIKSTLDVATREFDRSKALREKQVISESDIEQAEAQYRAAQARYAVAQAQVKQREAAFKTAEVRLSYTQISVSWDDGSPKRMVGERLVDQGAMLRANDPIVSVLDIDTVLAVVYAIEKDYPHLKEGQSVSITTDAFPGEIFTGKVVRKAPLLRETSRQARVEIEVANADRRLAPGMFVRVAVQFDEVANARVVPLNAVVRRDDKNGIFVVDTTTKTARFVPVTIGISTPHKCEIKNGGVDGLVITLGQHLLEDGNSITWEESNP
jgi:RND family efflux transporter MFP subunit